MIRATQATFCDWWWPAVFGAPWGEEIRQGLAAALGAMLAPFPGQGFVHRDYFPANLIPTLRGSAFVCAEATLLIDETDPFAWGIRAA